MLDLIKRRDFLRCALAGVAAAGACALGRGGVQAQGKRPHIVFFYADDMGIGDVGAYNPDSAIPTPHHDRLAREGMRFTDAHSCGAVCVPSRYAFLTGRYYWRGENRGLDGYGSNVVELDRLTLPDMLRAQGYYTAGVGKWHLGLQHQEPVDYAKPLRPGPLDHGFDYYWGIPSSLDFAPYVYMENDRVLAQPTEHTEGTPWGTGPFHREGPMAPGFDHSEVLPKITDKAVEVIETHAQERAEQPLFLYFPLNAPHTPWLPTDEYQGKSQAGDYGDFVHQVDASLGAVMDALERAGMADDTLLIATSDNGGLQSWLPEEFDHQKNLHFRGQKGDIWEGGHRMPLIARWPGRVAAGSTSDALLSQSDLFATFAAITGYDLPDNAAEDSLNMLPVLLGDTPKTPIRQTMVHDSLVGFYSLREGDWKLIEGQGGGGLRSSRELYEPGPDDPPGQLYNLAEDPGEENNLYNQHPVRVERMAERLREYRESGRSRARTGPHGSWRRRRRAEN